MSAPLAGLFGRRLRAGPGAPSRARAAAPAGLWAVLLRNTSAQALAHACAVGLGLVTAMVLARHLGVEGFARFNYVFAFSYFALALSDLGLATIVVREAAQARERAGQIIGSVLVLRLLVAAAATVGTWAAILLMGFPPPLRQALAVWALVLPLTAAQLPAAIFQVMVRLEYPAVLGTLNRLLGFLGLMAAVWMGWGLVGLFGALLAAEAVSLVVLLRAAHAFVRPVWRVDLGLWRRVLRASLPLGAAGLFTAVVNRVDLMLLERLADMREVGLYAAAYKVTSLLEALPLMAMGTVYPLMARAATENPAELRALYARSTALLGGIGLGLGVLVSLAAPALVRLLFGPRFAGAEVALGILVWSSVCLFIAISGGNCLISLGRERVSLGILGVAAAINVGLNLVWIPAWGYVGAASATAVTFLWILLATTAAVRAYLPPEEPVTALAAAGVGARSRVPGDGP